MVDGFVGALREEIERIESALSSDPRFVRWRHLQQTLALYEPDMTDERLLLKSPQAGRPPSPDRDKILRQVARIIHLNEPHPITTREILLQLRSSDIEIEGSNPVNTLSAMLSNAKQFVSHGRAGWTLMSTRLNAVVLQTYGQFPAELVRETVTTFDLNGHFMSPVREILFRNAQMELGRGLDEEEQIIIFRNFIAISKSRLQSSV